MNIVMFLGNLVVGLLLFSSNNSPRNHQIITREPKAFQNIFILTRKFISEFPNYDELTQPRVLLPNF